MMDKYDEILQIFETQKEEISLMSTKINELEKTNLFLMQYIEKKDMLPAVCDYSVIQRYREQAIDKELTLACTRNKTHNDATICETSLDASFEGIEWKNSYQLPQNCVPCTMSTSVPRMTFTSRSNDVTMSPVSKTDIGPVSRSGNLNLRISNFSPTRRREIGQRNILDTSTDVESPIVSGRSKSSDGKKNTLIGNVSGAIETSNEIFMSNHSERPNMHTQEVTSNHTSTKSDSLIIAQSSVDQSNINKDDMLKQVFDCHITTLEESQSRINEGTECSLKEMFNVSTDERTIEKILNNKGDISSNLDDRHTQMKLLLTSQLMKSDLLHRSLEENNKKIMDIGFHLVQQNSSNKAYNARRYPIEEVEDEINSEITPRLSAIQIRKQSELERLNNNLKNQVAKRGFAKFTALIKGYIVRTLLETEKVRGIIITIKDTAKMALSIRQERLSGDCAQHSDNTLYTNRRTNQETVSFQNRLISQLRHALNELHEIFFIWPSSSRMSLQRNHINQLITSSTKFQIMDSADGQGPSTINLCKTKRVVHLSSATIKRRQKMALRPSNYSTEENGNKNSISRPSQRKPTYTSPYGCRGFPVGSHTRSANGQSKNTTDRKSRTNNVSHRRGPVRKINEPYINPVVKDSRPSASTAAVDRIESCDHDANHAIPGFSNKTTEYRGSQQQQQWVQPKTITTSISSEACGDGHTYNGGFVASILAHQKLTKNAYICEDSHESPVRSKFPDLPNFSPNSFKKVQANTNNTDWRSRTFNVVHQRTKENSENGRINDVSLSDQCSDETEKNNNMDNTLSGVEVDVDDLDDNPPYKNNPRLSIERYTIHSRFFEDPTDSERVVLVDVSQKSTESDSATNELRSTYNSNTSNLVNKPVVTASNTKFSIAKTQPPFKHVVSQTKTNADFDFSSACAVPSRTFRIRKRIIAGNSIYSSAASQS